MSVNKAMYIHVQILISHYRGNQYSYISSAISLVSYTIALIIISRLDSCKTAKSYVRQTYINIF
jgi:hypothetical protein